MKRGEGLVRCRFAAMNDEDDDDGEGEGMVEVVERA